MRSLTKQFNLKFQFKVAVRTFTAFLRTRLGRYVKPRRYQQIFDEIDKVKPRVIMEVGTWNGARAEEMIKRAAKYHPVKQIEYIGFDLFENMNKDIYRYEISKLPPSEINVRKRLESTGAKVMLITGYTTETMRNISSLPHPDLVFIDGGHEAETVRNDWSGVKKIMDSNTVVIFDDYWHNRKDGPKVVIDGIDRKAYQVSLMPEVDVFFNPDFGRLVISLVKVVKQP